MPETSIVVKATDRYSDAVKKMATASARALHQRRICGILFDKKFVKRSVL